MLLGFVTQTVIRKTNKPISKRPGMVPEAAQVSLGQLAGWTGVVVVTFATDSSNSKKRNRWLRHWQGRPPSIGLLVSAAFGAALMIIPVIYVLLLAAQADGSQWARLWSSRIPTLLGNTLGLTAAVTVASTTIGGFFAFLTMRTDLPGRTVWQWLVAAPLAIPPYIGALAYILIFGPRGLVFNWLGFSPLSVYGFAGAFLVLTLFTYPYTYLISAAALRRLNLNFEEAGLSCGMPYWKVLLKVTLPMLRPSIGAGGVLIALYVLSDFGAIAMLRYETFTRAIYYQMTGRFDQTAAAVLSLVLMAITVLVLTIERFTRAKDAFHQNSGTYRRPRTIALGRMKLPALLLISLVTAAAVLLPVVALSYWTYLGWGQGTIDQRFWGFAWNSFSSAALAAVIVMFMALPLAYLKSRYPSKTTAALLRIAYGGYALPGVIVALGVMIFYDRFLPIFYGSLSMLVLAYAVRFLPQSMQSQDAALELVSPRLDEAARSLGQNSFGVMFKVILPAIFPGILAGGALAFVSALKELPAALLLRPAGFDTLSVRIWMESVEGFYTYAAPAALLLIVVSVLPLRLILNKY